MDIDIIWSATQLSTTSNKVEKHGCTDKNIYLKNNCEIYFTGCVCDVAANKLLEIVKTLDKKYIDEVDKIVNKFVDNTKTFNIDPNTFNNCSIQFSSLKDTVFNDIASNNPIKLYITSTGGSLLEGFKMADVVKQSKIPIYTYCKGYVASAATLPYIYGQKRYMDKNSYFLIHQLRGVSAGKFDELQISIGNKTMFMGNIKKMYNEQCGISNEALDDLLKNDDWYNADMCKELNLVDEII